MVETEETSAPTRDGKHVRVTSHATAQTEAHMTARAGLAERLTKDLRTDTVAPLWIIVCEKFHGAVGPIASEALARELAVLASEAAGCSYRAVRLGTLGRRPSETGSRI